MLKKKREKKYYAEYYKALFALTELNGGYLEVPPPSSEIINGTKLLANRIAPDGSIQFKIVDMRNEQRD